MLDEGEERLALVRAQAHGGTLEVRSEFAEGATFALVLPTGPSE